MRPALPLLFAALLILGNATPPPVEAPVMPRADSIDDARVPPAWREDYAHDMAQQVIAAERAFAAAAARDGQWTAFRRFAAADALMFTPSPVRAQRWLRGRRDPPRAVTWQPHQIVIACDGTLAASTGAAQWPDGSHGYFVTIWRRQADGWKWVADMGGPVSEALVAPPHVAVRVADCRPGARVANPGRHQRARGFYAGASGDGTLSWTVNVWPETGATTIVWLRERDGEGVRMVAAIGDDQGNAP